MKFKLGIASVALLATAAAPAWALQLGQIQVKSGLNQPLVAAIPLHPASMAELEGLTVGLASADDFTRSGLQLTPTDRSLRFHVVSDNNGQKLILVTSSEPVADPFLDFLVQVNTHQGKQVREFVVLLNPVIAAPAPAVQAAPVVAPPAAAPQPAEVPTPLPPPATPPAPEAQPQPKATPQPENPKAQRQPAPEPQVQAQPKPATGPKPQVKAAPQARSAPQPVAKASPKPKPHAQPAPSARAKLQTQAQVKAPPKPKPAPQPQPAPKPRAVAPPPPLPAAAAQAGRKIPVQRGDTLYSIAKDTSQGTGASINQMMMALQSANPEAFFKNNINDLRAGAILRIPTREEIDKTSIAQANAQVHRQYEAWRGVKPRAATVLEGAAAQAAARTAPQPKAEAPASDHLTLVPPTGGANGAGNRPGVAGGTGHETVAGLQQRLQNEHASLASLEQSNSDLESRVRSLDGIAGNSDKLLMLKAATVAELQKKLAAVQAGNAARTTASAAANAARQGSVVGAKSAARKPQASTTPWFDRPLSWIIAGLIVLALILIGLLRPRRRGKPAAVAPAGPLPNPDDVSPQAVTAAYAASLRARLAENPDDLDAHLALCRLYHAQGDVEQFVAAAEAMHAHVHDPGSMEWHEVAVIGEELAPGDPLFAAPGEPPPAEPQAHPDAPTTPQQPADAAAIVASEADAPTTPVVEPPPEPGSDKHLSNAMAAWQRAAAADAPDDLSEWQTPTAAADTREAQGAVAGGSGAGAAAAKESGAANDPAPKPAASPVPATDAAPEFSDDPVDTKLDLARAYLDMGDPAGARAMLDEVLEEGSQAQQDAARRLLVETTS